MNPLTQPKNTTILPVLIVLTLACFALSPSAQAVCQDGCDIPNFSTFLGNNALVNNTAVSNTAIGASALQNNTTGSQNTANGEEALSSNTTGLGNTATGFQALFLNTEGGFNTASGEEALWGSTGSFNTASGFQALFGNTTGTDNTATGFRALNHNTTGKKNTASGFQALYANSGNDNTATGADALFSNTTGSQNTAVGFGALRRNKRGSNNIALGFSAGNLTNGDNNIDIANDGVRDESNAIRIGTVGAQTNTFIAGISGATVPTGVAVIVDSSGHLGTTTSSARFKEAIKPMDKASEAILALKPVTFHYKKELDRDGIAQFGLVAEQVEKVNPDLVARDEQGKPYTVRYEAVNVMLLNEFIKARRQIDSQQKQIDALTAGLQKVSAQLELNKSAPRTVQNSQ